MLAPRLLGGRWLRSADLPEIVANQTAVETLRMPAVGSTIALSVAGVERKVALVGIIEEIDKAKIYLDERIWDRWTGEGKQANTLCLVGRDRSYQGVMALKRAVERVVESSDLKVLYVMSQAERTKIIADHLDIVLAVLTLLAFLVLGVSALGSASAASITVMERTREIGVLRAIGAQPRRIIRLFVSEGLLTSGVGLLAGLALSWPLSLVASSFFGSLMLGEGAILRFALAPWGLAITAIVTLLFGWLASRLPAHAALGIPTRSALAYE
jgi:putative ABC transport system permease protein